MTFMKDAPLTDDHRPFENVRQFANVAGPIITLQAVVRLLADAPNTFTHPVGKQTDEMARQQWNVFAAILQRRHCDWENIQPVKQIRSETSGSGLMSKVT